MSDFDREAEREKLREKYERDKQKREASERMSELLLQGATMTNRHCPECHSPVFRYEDRHFCPTCETEITEGADAASESDQQATSGDADGARQEPADTETSGAAGQAAEPSESEAKSHQADRSGTDSRPSSGDETPTPAGERRPARVQPPARKEDDASPGRGRARDSRRGRESRQEASEAFHDAEASLRREIGSLTRKAEETNDVGRKRDLLAAAREAAETLQAIRRL